MIKKNLIKTIYFITFIYLIVITFLENPIKENYSMLSSSLLGYFTVFGLCILLSFCFLIPSLSLNKKYWYLALGPLVGCLLPYKAFSGDAISNLHEVLAYVSFAMSVLSIYLNIQKYKERNLKKGNLYQNIFIVVFVVDVVLYLETMGVVGIEEFILLGTMTLIDCLIISEVLKERQ